MHYADKNDEDNSGLRFTIDTIQNYAFVSKIYNHFDGSNVFSYVEILEAIREHPECIAINRDIIQNKIKYEGEA